MRRGLISVALLIAFVAILAISRHAINSSSTTTSTASPTKSTTTTSPSTGTTAPSTTTTVGTDDCQANDFSGVYNEGQGAAGTIYASVTITKTTAGSCTLKGWPILTLQSRQGAIVTTTAGQRPLYEQRFSVLHRPGERGANDHDVQDNGSVTFSLAYSDVPTGTTTCPSASTLSVQFVTGGPTVTVTPQYAVQPCSSGEIWVSPFY